MQTDVSHAALIAALQQAVGLAAVHTDQERLQLAAADLYSQGPPPVAVIRPSTSEDLAKAVIAVAVTAGTITLRRIPMKTRSTMTPMM